MKVHVLSRQPKHTSKFRSWLNVRKEGDEKPFSVNWDDVVDWEVLPEPEQLVLFSASEEMSQRVIDAKEKEVENLRDNDVFESVEYRSQSLISCKWVFTEKIKNGEKVVKARLVARGFEERMSNARTDSPTCSRQSLRMHSLRLLQ